MKNVVKFFHSKFISLADHTIDQVYESRARRILNQCSSVGTDVGLRMPLTIYHPQGLAIGNQVSIGEYTHIRASGGVSIGDRVLIASHVIITSRGHPKSIPRYGVNEDGPIHIEDDVWISANAVILPNTYIGRGSIVAAGAVVTEDVPPFTIVGGIPAHVIGQVPL